MRPITLAWVLAAMAGLPAATPAAEPQPRVLFLTHSAGFRHDVVKRPDDGSLSLAEKKLQEAAAGRFEVVPTQDLAELTREKLRGYQGVVFYTTGELNIDKEALIEFVRAGGGFAGVHSATDTFYKHEPYGRMIGGYFDGHPWHEKVRVRVENRTHPATAHLGESFEITDEIYQFRDWARNRARVLLSLDPASVDLTKPGVKRTDRDFALAWTSEWGRGRVFYTALGHREEVWADPRFLTHLVNGISWTLQARAPTAPGGEGFVDRHAALFAPRFASSKQAGPEGFRFEGRMAQPPTAALGSGTMRPNPRRISCCAWSTMGTTCRSAR